MNSLLEKIIVYLLLPLLVGLALLVMNDPPSILYKKFSGNPVIISKYIHEYIEADSSEIKIPQTVYIEKINSIGLEKFDKIIAYEVKNEGRTIDNFKFEVPDLDKSIKAGTWHKGDTYSFIVAYSMKNSDEIIFLNEKAHFRDFFSFVTRTLYTKEKIINRLKTNTPVGGNGKIFLYPSR